MEKNIIKILRDTYRRFGSIYPIIAAENGEIIDGKHRQQVGDWEVKKLPITDKKDAIALRLVLNVCRRIVPPEEKSQGVNELAEILLSGGVEKGNLVEAIAKETAMSTRWVYKYLDKRFKEQTKPVKQKNEIAYHAIPPYRRIILYIDNNTARLIDDLTYEKKFKDTSETTVWLIKEALMTFGKLNRNLTKDKENLQEQLENDRVL